MSSKKTEMVHIRLTSEEKADLTQLAEEKMTDVSTMMRKMAAMLCQASRQHGTRLIWPPQFNYYPATESRQELLLVAEEPEEYPAKKHAG
jgi:hypothetical protein